MLSYRRKFLSALWSPLESDPEVIELEHAFGRLVEIWRQSGHWTRNVRRVQVVEERVRQQRQLRGARQTAAAPHAFSILGRAGDDDKLAQEPVPTGR
jgi:hypothetical protein